MIRRSTWIVLAVFVLAAAALLFLQRSRGSVTFVSDPVTPSATSAPLLLAGWLPADIQAVEWRGDGQTLTLTQTAGGEWTVGPSQSGPADAGKVEALRSSLASLRPISSVGSANPLDTLGLAAPAQVIVVRGAGGRQAQISIGGATPTGSGYYAQVDGGEPLVVSTFALEEIFRQLQPDFWATPTPTPPLETTATPTP